MQQLSDLATDSVVSIRDSLLAALSLQQGASPDRALWHDRLERFLLLQTLRRADRAFGNFAKADDDACLQQHRVEEQHGPGYRPASAEEAAENSVWLDLQRAEATYEEAGAAHDAFVGGAYDEALRDLVLTPAPDIFAVRLKVELIAEDGLDAHRLGHEPMEVIKRDVARLADERASQRDP